MSVIALAFAVMTTAQAGVPAPAALNVPNVVFTLRDSGLLQTTAKDVSIVSDAGPYRYGKLTIPSRDVAEVYVATPIGPADFVLIHQLGVWWIVRLNGRQFDVGYIPLRSKQFSSSAETVMGLNPKTLRNGLLAGMLSGSQQVSVKSLWYVSKDVAKARIQLTGLPVTNQVGAQVSVSGPAYIALYHTARGWTLFYSHFQHEDTEFSMSDPFYLVVR